MKVWIVTIFAVGEKRNRNPWDIDSVHATEESAKARAEAAKMPGHRFRVEEHDLVAAAGMIHLGHVLAARSFSQLMGPVEKSMRELIAVQAETPDARTLALIAAVCSAIEGMDKLCKQAAADAGVN